MTLYLGQVLLFSPLGTGVASLPFSAGITLGAGISSELVERLATLSVESSYAAHVLPAPFVTSFGLRMAAVTMTLTAVHGIAEERAGVASALVNMAQ
ncbi:MFS transporter [Microvirga makkahensis]|uniref:Uncharacterized protein n=1 Tax=Microvirga makkahensis TaxID=1128670 RepID=A0A7X3MNY2_9HYPH|nr:MFS transporter [Microvirga makkahensis]MXQ10485.1 hypothetical protein [Microvirga makkahensis]